MKKHSKHLSLRKPEATSAACAMGFNQVAVNSFFSLLEEAVDTNKLQVENIWNCDKIGISSVPKCLSKIR